VQARWCQGLHLGAQPYTWPLSNSATLRLNLSLYEMAFSWFSRLVSCDGVRGDKERRNWKNRLRAESWVYHRIEPMNASEADAWLCVLYMEKPKIFIRQVRGFSVSMQPCGATPKPPTFNVEHFCLLAIKCCRDLLLPILSGQNTIRQPAPLHSGTVSSKHTQYTGEAVRRITLLGKVPSALLVTPRSCS
jgi:hypothetical protein